MTGYQVMNIQCPYLIKQVSKFLTPAYEVFSFFSRGAVRCGGACRSARAPWRDPTASTSPLGCAATTSSASSTTYGGANASSPPTPHPSFTQTQASTTPHPRPRPPAASPPGAPRSPAGPTPPPGRRRGRRTPRTRDWGSSTRRAPDGIIYLNYRLL